VSKLSNPFSTGGGGNHFESQVQASFVVLMLTGGFAPILPCWPICKIKLQGKIDGYDTDDLIVYVENPENKEKRKLIGQVKHSISVTKGSLTFGEVVGSAWNDFNNLKLFSRGKDSIALITGPLNGVDAKNVPWILNQARSTNSVGEFFRNVEQANFSPSKSGEKLNVIKHHLKAANGDVDVSDDELYSFLQHFHLLGYDLGGEVGVVVSLLHSHISQFQPHYPHWLWPRLISVIQSCNQESGTITRSNLPEDIQDAFKPRPNPVAEVPERLRAVSNAPEINSDDYADASYVALVILVGSWDERKKRDVQTLTDLLGLSYDEWIKRARTILHKPSSPLSLKNGVWSVKNKKDLWGQLGSQILDPNLEDFRRAATSILTELNPAFELPVEERYAAAVHGKVLEFSDAMRQGVAEGLAILGALPEYCCNSSHANAEGTALSVVREVFSGADWRLWGSLNSLLPLLAEAAPTEFIRLVGEALREDPSPFDQLFEQEGDGFAGSNYLTGLLWALEGLAWDERHLVPICMLLAELANHDPGGQWANRPENSLIDILLPWMPHTLASIEKREVAVTTILKEWPDVGWKLILALLHNQHQTTSGTHKPEWRQIIPEDWEKGVSNSEYWRQSSMYAELSVRAAGYDVRKLSDLIDYLDSLTDPAFKKLLEVLSSDAIRGLPEDQTQCLWRQLSRFTRKHRLYADSDWALPEELIVPIEDVMADLAPSSPFLLYADLFSGRDFDLYEESENWSDQKARLDERRAKVISGIKRDYGIDGIIRFSESVDSPRDVGAALSVIASSEVDSALLPDFLSSQKEKQVEMVNAFVLHRHNDQGWDWCDGIDISGWQNEQIGKFLACLPFTRETWERSNLWLGRHDVHYWSRTSAFLLDVKEDVSFVADKLIKYGRPNIALRCLARVVRSKNEIDSALCVRVLLEALNSEEPSHIVQRYDMVELIKHLQLADDISGDDLFKVEWAYLPLLTQLNGNKPAFLHQKLADEPDFFCEVIRLIYRSNLESKSSESPSEEKKNIATNAYRLLRGWQRPPGVGKDGTFDQEHFKKWLRRVRDICLESGHAEVAMITVGSVLIFSPEDLSGLWINKTLAEALNDTGSDEMRRGFRTALFNSRGAHTVDPSGRPETDLAEKYTKKADDVENAGFYRLAMTLRDLAESYVREAEQVRSNYANDDVE